MIGSTGFVGSALARQHSFQAAVNSKTIDCAMGARFDTAVCAAAPGSMFEANRSPTQDRERVDRLMAQLAAIGASRFVLVSTIAVLDGFAALSEDAAVYERTLAYGVNRRRLEEFAAGHFKNTLIVRLPALFGDGLRKNFLFDMINLIPSMLTADKIGAMKSALSKPLAAVVDTIYDWDERYSLLGTSNNVGFGLM